MAVETLEAPQTNLSGVARILVRAGRIESKVAEELSRQAREKKSSFVAQLIESGTLRPLALAHALSQALAVPLLDLDAVDPRQLPQGIIDAKLIAQYRVYPLGKRGGRLSAGQRQLVSFARAFLAAPAVLVLDEATSLLDIPSERQVQVALRTVLAGRTAVIIAHRLSTVAIADRVLVLDRGRITEDGTPGELMSGDGEYAALHTSWAASLT